jgi:hypothetical protein
MLTSTYTVQNGFEVAVFDREPSINAHSRDWTILLHWAMPTMAKLLQEDVLKNLPRAICNPYLNFNTDVEYLPCYNGITGEILFKSPLPGSRRISRQKLRGVLAEGLDIRWGRTLNQISFPSGGDSESPVQLTFDGGQMDVADYVLGTDGASSKVRELLLGAEAARVQLSGFLFATGIMEYRDADKVEAVVKAHPVAAITMGMEAVAGCGGIFIHSISLIHNRVPTGAVRRLTIIIHLLQSCT